MSVPAPSTAPPSPRPLPYQPLVIVLTAVVAGILVDRFWPMSLGAWFSVAAGALATWGMIHIKPRPAVAPDDAPNGATAGRGFMWDVLSTLTLLAAVAAAAGAWHHCRWYLFAADDLGYYARRKAQPVCVEILVRSQPRALPPSAPDPMRVMPPGDGWRFDADAVALRNGATWQPVAGRTTLLVQGQRPEINVGDRVRCFGQLSAPAGPQNPGAFDRAAYFRADRVRCRLVVESPDCISMVAPGSAWSVSRMLAGLRAHGAALLDRYLDQRQAELANAVLLGLREELDYGRTEAFLTTGTIHILSISGLHVGILAAALFWLMRYTPVPRGWAVVGIAAVTLLYALMVDVEPPVVRATVLVLIACMAVWLGRKPLSMNSLAAAALVVLAINPACLFHVGAQLSFLCVAVLILISPRRPHAADEEDKKNDPERTKRTLRRLVMQNRNWLDRVMRRPARSVIGIALAGMVIWLVTLPLIMTRFHILSLAAVFLNVPLWPLMTLSLLSGFGVLLFGSICSPLGCLCGGLCNVSFRWTEYVVNGAERMPGSHFWMPGPPDWWLWAFYAGLGLLLAFPRLRPHQRWHYAPLAVAWLAVGFTVVRWPHDRDQLDCTFLSMGHGCAVVLELPSGETILYDAGQFGSPSAGVRAISGALWDHGITHLDAVVLTHPDIDHYNALPGLLEKFSVGTVYVTPAMFEKRNRAVAALRSTIDAHGVPVREVRSGEQLPAGEGCTLEVLHPPRYGGIATDNSGSMVLAVDYRDCEVLLTGDVESSGLSALLAEKPRPCSVLLAPHHGSRNSNSPELARWCKPVWVIFSGDGRWSFPESESPYQAVGSSVLHTHDGGAIHVQIDAAGVRVSPFVESRP